MLGMIRQDWLDKVGLPLPKTLDEFYNALLAFQEKDVNGNGLKDEVALIPDGTSGLVSQFWGLGIPQWFGLGASIVSAIDGKAVSPWYQSGVKDYFTYMNKLYKAGLLQITKESGETAANRIGYITSYSAEYWEEPNIITPAGAAKAYFNPIVIDTVPGIPARVYHTEYGYSVFWSSSMHAIPAGSKNIEKTVKLIDHIVGDDESVITRYGIKGYDYNENPDGTRTNFFGTIGVDRYTRNTQVWYGFGALFPALATYGTDTSNELVTLQGQMKDYGIPADFRKEYYDNWFSQKWPFVVGSEAVLAFPITTEVGRIAAIAPDLTTYSDELSTSLILGEKSLANWDSYIADLKRLGLDELINIFQARLDRAK
jgi:hypothetical protein